MLLAFALAAAARPAGAAHTDGGGGDGVLTGAIRWDAWFGAPAAPHQGIIGRAVTESLRPTKYHYRLPFFAGVDNETGAVLVDGDSAGVMARENTMASAHGIDYWAFCTYPIGCANYQPNSTACLGAQCCADNFRLSYALERYLASAGTLGKDKPHFSLVLQASGWYPVIEHGGNETLAEEAKRLAGYFALDAYQKVGAGSGAKRPLVFLLGGSAETPQLPEALALLRQRSKATVGAEPYFVMAQNAPTPELLENLVKNSAALGAQGLSQYNLVGNRTVAGWPYAKNMRFEQRWWPAAKAAAGSAGSVIVPVSAGWDSRPRQEVVMP